MNRIDRLFAITTELQSRGRVRAADLASRFEVSQRTIYRDISALSQSGIPVVSLPGQGYALSDGYFLPPLRFSTQEATALVLGTRLLASVATPEFAQSARGAVAKILAAVDEESRLHQQQLADTIDLSMTQGQSPRFDLDDERITTLHRAILDRRVVSLHYFGRNRAERTSRQVEPLRLSYVNDAWYLSAFCQMRGEERAFRLDRIEHFSVESIRFRSRPVEPAATPEPTPVTVRFVGDAARWAQERQHWSFVSATISDRGLIATYRPGNLDEIAPWILGWGTAAEVIDPPELRARLRNDALAIAKMLT